MTLPPTRGRRALGAAAASVALLAVLTACTNSDFTLSAEDAYGTWRAGSDLPTTLELADDGTFTASAWPIDVGCSGRPPLTAAELHDSEMIDFSGRWEETDEGNQNDLYLYPESDRCRVHSIQTGLRSEDGVLYSCTLLGREIDLSRAENWFILYLGEPESTPASSRCFNYN